MNNVLMVQNIIQNDLLNKGYSEDDILTFRKEANFDYVSKADKANCSKLADTGDYSYIKYKEKYYLLYVIEDNVVETDHNAFIGGNNIIALSKYNYSLEELQLFKDKQLALTDIYAPLVFPSLLWRKRCVSKLKNNGPTMKITYALYNDFLKKGINSKGKQIRIKKDMFIGQNAIYTLDGVALLLEFIEMLNK